MTQKKKRPVFLWIIIILLAGVIGVCGYMLLRELVFMPSANRAQVETIQTIAFPTEEKTESSVPQTQRKTANFKALQEKNPDIIGWITVPGTVIDYPVLQSGEDDPQYYLYRDYEKNDTAYGSIFLNAKADAQKSRSLTLYGHHMNDGQMFASLLQYADLEFYQKTPIIHFDTPDGPGDWKVFAVFKTNTLESQGKLFRYTVPDFDTDEEFLDFIHQIRIRSILDTDVTLNEDDQLLLLSTCSYEYNDFRTVVAARKVRAGESPEVDVKKAKLAENPLYPICWYNGGSAPDYPETFARAQSANMTAWYDGSEN